MTIQGYDAVAALAILLLVAYLATESLRYTWGVRTVRPMMLFCAALCAFVTGLVTEPRWLLFVLAFTMVIIFVFEIIGLRKAKRRGWKPPKTYEELVAEFDRHASEIHARWAAAHAARQTSADDSKKTMESPPNEGAGKQNDVDVA